MLKPMKGIIDREGPYRIPTRIIRVEGERDVENTMVVDLDNASPMVKLLAALLDDPHGITEETFETLKLVVLKNGGSKVIRYIMSLVEGSEGRVYLPEGWNDRFGLKIPATRIPVIGTLREDGQVEFKEPRVESSYRETVVCKFCHEHVPADTAHAHQGAWVGDKCCWEERLRSSE